MNFNSLLYDVVSKKYFNRLWKVLSPEQKTFINRNWHDTITKFSEDSNEIVTEFVTHKFKLECALKYKLIRPPDGV